MASASNAGRSSVLVTLAQATSGQSETVTYQTASRPLRCLSAAVVLGDAFARLAAAEAVLGLLIEVSFIATFTQRFFGR
jgi:hypothetical protein